jgi:hypothetical protein
MRKQQESNGLYEDWESFSDTETLLGLKGRPLPPGTAAPH